MCIGVWCSVSPEVSGLRKHTVWLGGSSLFILSSWLNYIVRSGSPFGIILKNAMSTGLINMDCYGFTTENSPMCVCFLMVCCHSIVLITPMATWLPTIVDIEWQICKFAVPLNLFYRFSVPVCLVGIDDEQRLWWICCHIGYYQIVVTEERLRVCIFFAVNAFDLYCHLS